MQNFSKFLNSDCIFEPFLIICRFQFMHKLDLVWKQCILCNMRWRVARVILSSADRLINTALQTFHIFRNHGRIWSSYTRQITYRTLLTKSPDKAVNHWNWRSKSAVKIFTILTLCLNNWLLALVIKFHNFHMLHCCIILHIWSTMYALFIIEK